MDGVRIDFGDGVSAVDRTSRTVVLLTAQALVDLELKGYDRAGRTNVRISEDGLPVWVTLDGRNVFVIDFDLSEIKMATTGAITVAGRWLEDVRKRSWAVRLWRRFLRLFKRKKDA